MDSKPAAVWSKSCLYNEIMLTRREILQELRRVGITKTSQLKACAKDFENYMAKNHEVFVSKTKRPLPEVGEEFFPERSRNSLSSKQVNPLRLEKTEE